MEWTWCIHDMIHIFPMIMCCSSVVAYIALHMFCGVFVASSLEGGRFGNAISETKTQYAAEVCGVWSSMLSVAYVAMYFVNIVVIPCPSCRLQVLQEQKKRQREAGAENEADMKQYADAVALEKQRLELLQKVKRNINVF